jgi:hypothetical protein
MKLKFLMSIFFLLSSSQVILADSCNVKIDEESVYVHLRSGASRSYRPRFSVNFEARLEQLKRVNPLKLLVGQEVEGYKEAIESNLYSVCDKESCNSDEIDHEIKIVTFLEGQIHRSADRNRIYLNTSFSASVLIYIDGEMINLENEKGMKFTLSRPKHSDVMDEVKKFIQKILPICPLGVVL